MELQRLLCIPVKRPPQSIFSATFFSDAMMM